MGIREEEFGLIPFIGKVTNFVEFVKGCLGLNGCIFDLFII